MSGVIEEKLKEQREKWIRLIVYDLQSGACDDTVLRKMAHQDYNAVLNRRHELLGLLDLYLSHDLISEDSLNWWLDECDEPLRRQLMQADLIEHGFDPFDKVRMVSGPDVASIEHSYRFVVGSTGREGEIGCPNDFDQLMVGTLNRTMHSPFSMPALRLQTANRRYSQPSSVRELGRSRIWKFDQLSRLIVLILYHDLIPAKENLIVMPVRQGKRAWWVSVSCEKGRPKLWVRDFQHCAGVSLEPGSLLITPSHCDQKE